MAEQDAGNGGVSAVFSMERDMGYISTDPLTAEMRQYTRDDVISTD
jgi:hypothetical protein